MSLFDFDSVFKDESVFSPDYIPDSILFRDAEIKSISLALAPILKGGMPSNILLYGPPGTGKTTVARYVADELSKSSNSVKISFVNCWQHRSRVAVLHKVGSEIGMLLPRRGIAADEMLDELAEFLSKNNFSLVVFLDEVDAVDSNVLYDLVRFRQNYGQTIALVLITNQASFMSSIDSRILSSLMHEEIEFAPYDFDSARAILEQRAKLGFVSYDNPILDVVAEHSVNRSDIRFGISVLYKAGKLADKHGSDTVTLLHVEEALANTSDIFLKSKIAQLSSADKDMLLALVTLHRRGVSPTTGEFYEFYSKFADSPYAVRTFRKKITQLANMGLLEFTYSSKGQRGRTRIIKLKVSPELLLKGD